jgi:hypothetical protein
VYLALYLHVCTREIATGVHNVRVTDVIHRLNPRRFCYALQQSVKLHKGEHILYIS